MRPVNQSKWFASKISNELLAYKKNLLKTRYQDVIAITDDSVGAQELLVKKLNIKHQNYKDVADISLSVLMTYALLSVVAIKDCLQHQSVRQATGI